MRHPWEGHSIAAVLAGAWLAAGIAGVLPAAVARGVASLPGRVVGFPGEKGKGLKAWRAARRVVLICSLTSALARKENRLRCMVLPSFLSVAVLVGSIDAYALQAQTLDPEAARLIEKAHQAHDLG